MNLVEYRLLLQFHNRRMRDLAGLLIEDFKNLESSGFYKAEAPLKTLWDEYCWIVNHDSGSMADTNSSIDISRWAGEYVSDLSPEEVEIHSYVLNDDIDTTDEGPFGDPDLVASGIASAFYAIAGERDMEEFEWDADTSDA